MNFTLLETVDEIPVVFYSAGVMLIQPKIDLDQFTHVFFPITQLEIQRKENDLEIALPEQTLLFHFDQLGEAEQIINDLVYLFSPVE